MPLHLFPSLLLYILVVGYSPGPANIYALSCSLKYGRRAALRMWRGELAGFFIAAVAAALVTHTLGTALGNYAAHLKYAGAAYLLWLAWHTYRSKGEVRGEAMACSFVSGLLVQLTNAKIILFNLTMFSMFVLPHSQQLADLLWLTPVLALAGPGANLVWLLAGVWLGKLFAAYRRQADAVMAALLAGCALWMVG